MDDNNASLVTDEMKAAVDEARQKIIDGEIEVHDYYDGRHLPGAQLLSRP